MFGSQLSPVTQSASSVPLPLSTSGVAVLVNGIAAPLYYVSPGQLNVQIPYETTANSSAVVSVNNNGQVTTQSFQVAAAAPGIFTDSTGALVPTRGCGARAGDRVLHHRRRGRFPGHPGLARRPRRPRRSRTFRCPSERTTVTIGGAEATIDFIGIPWALVGVTQINVQVPNGIPTGAQPVVVTVGGVASAPATVLFQLPIERRRPLAIRAACGTSAR